MNRIYKFVASLFAIALLSLPGLLVPETSHAQGISINSVSSSSFCAGDPISVSITVTGYWGHKNAFSLQLSESDGSFTPTFNNIGSIVDSVPDTFAIVSSIPTHLSYSTHYRVRVARSNAYMVTADNGSDLTVGELPNNPGNFGPKFGVTDSLTLFDVYDPRDSEYWSFTADATPSTHNSSVLDRTTEVFTRYSTGGWKATVLKTIAPGGCSRLDTALTLIYDCSSPVVPYNAIVLDSDLTIPDFSSERNNYWVNPGVTLKSGRYPIQNVDTVFAESGSTVAGIECQVAYLKPGASWKGGRGIVIYAPGASIALGQSTGHECSGLAFDYSSAPPNKIIQGRVGSQLPSLPITLSPNPATGRVTVQGADANTTSVTITNILGEVVTQITPPRSAKFTFDISKLLPGVYYVRFESPTTVTTKKIVRE
jgi:hypothetical protein